LLRLKTVVRGKCCRKVLVALPLLPMLPLRIG
jgi:hypothetical protein